MGLHSGPVTAGVLRGERSRFQLFGDTMNTAARMEHNGVKSKIQISEETANILIACGKKSWVTLREDKIIAKGKGEMQTYWLELGHHHPDSRSHGGSSNNLDATDHVSCMSISVDDSSHGNYDDRGNIDTPTLEKPACSDKVLRLIGWNVEVLLRLLKQIMARRNATVRRARNSLPIVDDDHSCHGTFGTEMVLDEVKEIIELPLFDARAAKNQQDTDTLEMDPRIQQQLEDYVMTIGSGYRDNPCK
jgi:Adenylate and Guanylate cyclase catalytic domain